MDYSKLSDDELRALYTKESSKKAAPQGPTLGEDVKRSAGPALIRGTAGLLTGLPGTLDLAHRGAEWLAGKAGALGEIPKAVSEGMGQARKFVSDYKQPEN